MTFMYQEKSCLKFADYCWWKPGSTVCKIKALSCVLTLANLLGLQYLLPASKKEECP